MSDSRLDAMKRNQSRAFGVALGILLGTAGAPVTAQPCEGQWIVGPDQGIAGVDFQPLAAAAWDPDGAGPENEWLVLGGSFDKAGHVFAAGVAAWDGRQWRAFGSGVDGEVNAIAGYGGELFVGGEFATAGGVAASNIARWDGTAWAPVALGVNGRVRALAVYDGELVAAGEFTEAGGQIANRVAAWNGTGWRPLGNANASVNALVIHQGDLIAAGEFTDLRGALAARVARWNGSTWSQVGSLLPPGVRALLSHDDDLYVSGDVGVLHLDQSGTNWTALCCLAPGINALAVYEGRVIAGGNNRWMVPALVRAVGQWDGSVWQPMGTGFETIGGEQYVTTLINYQGQLLAIGKLHSTTDSLTGNEVRVDSIARWDGERWHPFSRGVSGGLVSAFLPLGDKLYFAGVFSAPGTPTASNVAVWDGTKISPLGSGIALGKHGGIVHALAHYRGNIFAGGSFSTGTTLQNVARWDGQAWHRVGNSPSDTVFALTVFQDELIAGGEFEACGPVQTLHVARWNGSGWHPLGSGIEGDVRALCVYDNELIAAGQFSWASGVAANSIAAWNGANWRPLGSGLQMGVQPAASALLVLDDELVVGGRFMRAGGISASGLAAWNGATWRSISTNWNNFGIRALAQYQGDLIQGGALALPPPQESCGSLVRHSKVGEVCFPTGVRGPVEALTVFQGELVLSADFNQSYTLAYGGWVRWTDTGIPWGVAELESLGVLCPGDSGMIQAQVADGYEAAAFAWQRDGIPLSDGPTGSGSSMSGTSTAILTIDAITEDDEGIYECLLTNECGAGVTNSLLLRVGPAADVDGDSMVGIGDIARLIQLWTTTVPPASPIEDLDGSGEIGLGDLAIVLTHWGEACPL